MSFIMKLFATVLFVMKLWYAVKTPSVLLALFQGQINAVFDSIS